MTTIIKIDRSTVRANPRAGATTTHIIGDEKMTFKTICSDEEYRHLKNDQGVTITWKSYNTDPIIEIAGSLTKGYDFTKLPGKWNVEGNKDIETVNHWPLPSYLFAFEPTKIECSNCENMVSHNLIQSDCYNDVCCDICPKCLAIDTFDYEFEDIYTVAKELNL